MTKKIVFILFSVFLLSLNSEIKAEDDFGKQFFHNFNLGWDFKHHQDYRMSNFYIGTAYGHKFDLVPKASWQVGANFNWGKYTIYSDGMYAMGSSNYILRTKSLSFPFTVSYDVSKTFFHGMKVYTGPVYELILSSTLNRNNYSALNYSQWGWTVGTKIRFLAIFNARLAYNYYPTSLFSNGNLNRSAISFSVGF
jgi:hypothetical protein